VQHVYRPDLVAALGGLVLAAITAVLALSVNRSNIGIPSESVRAGAAGVLLVDRLPGYAEDLRDLLPGPAVFPGVVDLERLELLQQPAEGGDGPEPGAGV
jgi:hypothetical protein